MSVVNQMLNALDARHAGSPGGSLAGVSVPAAARRPWARVAQVLALSLAAAAAGWGAWSLAPRATVGATQIASPPSVASAPATEAVAAQASSPAGEATVAALAAQVAAQIASAPAVLPRAPRAPLAVSASTGRRASVGDALTFAGGEAFAPAPPPAVPSLAAPEPVRWARSAASLAEQAAAPRFDATDGPVRIEKKPAASTPAQRATGSYAQAVELANSGHGSQAIDKAVQALADAPDHLAARQLAALLMYENKRPAEAAALLRAGLERQPRQPQFTQLLARIQAESGDADGALALLSQAQGLSAEGHALRAGLLMRQGRHREAIAAYDAVVRLDPAHAIGWLGLGIALDAEGQADPARQALLRAKALGTLPADLLAFIDQKLAVLR